MQSFRDIANLFEEIELRLIKSLKRNIAHHKNGEKAQGFDWTMWQAEKLRNINKFRRECTSIMDNYTNVIDADTRQLMEEEFSQAVSDKNEPQFFGVDYTKLKDLIDDTVNLEKHSETAALRTIDDVYRQTVMRAQFAMSSGTTTINQAIDMAVKDFLEKGINCIVYRDGRRVNIADYVRMALRSASTRAALQGKSERYKALGYDTVLVSQYSMCSETCLPWQGRVYINDVYTMWDGEIRETDGILWGKSNYCGKWFPLLSSAIHKGLFHPNCRHTILLWRDGDPLPEPVDNSETERRYKLEQYQRALERAVRKAKRKVEGLSDPDNISKARTELSNAQKQLREFIEKVNADEGETVLKRDYGREKIYSSDTAKNVDIPGGSGIIKSIDVDDFKMMSEGKEIDQKAIDTIADIIQKYEKSGDIYINDFYFGSLDDDSGGTPLLQIEPIADKMIRLNINTDIFSGKTVEQIDEMLETTKFNLAQNLEEAVIHECGHAKSLKGKTIKEIQNMYSEIADAHIKNVSKIAYNDGAEALAEIEILISRGSEVPDEAMEFYNKYIRGRK